MKKIALTAIVALGVAVPSLASAMDNGSLHSEKAQMIFAQIAAEQGAGGTK